MVDINDVIKRVDPHPYTARKAAEPRLFAELVLLAGVPDHVAESARQAVSGIAKIKKSKQHGSKGWFLYSWSARMSEGRARNLAEAFVSELVRISTSQHRQRAAKSGSRSNQTVRLLPSQR